MKELSLKIPATSANLGLGFDSIGLAVDLFLSITARPSSTWKFNFDSEALEQLPADEENMIVQTAKDIAKKFDQEMPSLEIDMSSDIPLAHGLGSSSTAVVAGIELANYFLELGMTDEDKIFIGTSIEGHPDNIGPCITGSVFIGHYEEKLSYYTTSLEGIGLIVSIPPYEINTNITRAALPEHYAKQTAVSQNSRNNVMLLALWQKDYDLMAELMMQDDFHEPYRKSLIPEYDDVKKAALDNGAYATVISGAGPTLLTLCPEDKVDQILEELNFIDHCTHKKVNVYHR